MSNSLVVNPVLQRHIDAYIADPPHAILLHGKKSSGKKALADHMAKQIATSRKHSKILYILPLEDKKTIGIDQIKILKTSLRTKDLAYRIIVIPDAEKLTTEAQNSFLKLLEEPPANVLFILTTSNRHALLATIRSRLLKLRYIAPTAQQQDEFTKRFNNPQANKLIAIADGRMGLLSALLNGDDSHVMLQSIELAKDLLSTTPDARLARVDGVIKEASGIGNTLDALLLACNAALSGAIANNREHKRWLDRLVAVEVANNQISHNVSAKLVLTRLFLVL